MRVAKGISQRELGRLVGTTGQTIGRYENGVDKPRGEILVKLSRFFGVGMGYLVGDTDDPTKNSNLPPEWEEMFKRLDRAGYKAKDVERAIRLVKAIDAVEIEK